MLAAVVTAAILAIWVPLVVIYWSRKTTKDEDYPQ